MIGLIAAVVLFLVVALAFARKADEPRVPDGWKEVPR